MQLASPHQRLHSAIVCLRSYAPVSAPESPQCGVCSLIWLVSEYESGYSRLAAFEDCDPSFLIYRKFEWLHNRVLLYHQDELQKLEQELKQLDKWDSTNGYQKALESHRKDVARRESKRKPLIAAIHDKLNKFGILKTYREAYGSYIGVLQTSCCSSCRSSKLSSSLRREAKTVCTR